MLDSRSKTKAADAETSNNPKWHLHPDPDSEPVEHCAKSSSSPAGTGSAPTSWCTCPSDPLYGSFAGDQGAWSTAKMYFTVPPNSCEAALLGKVLLKPTLTALGNFFGALQQPELHGLGQLHGGRLPAAP